jgi:hypothetical protein
MLKVSLEIKDFKQELSRIKREAQSLINAEITEITEFSTQSLIDVTPVDTGFARSQWKFDVKTNENGDSVGVISNGAPYIKRLNDGYSRQAPRFFIEKTLSQIGEIVAPLRK